MWADVWAATSPLLVRIFCCGYLLSPASIEGKMLPLKMGLPRLWVYYVSVSSYNDCYPPLIGKDFFFSGLSHHNMKSFLYFTSKCKQLHGLLPHHYWQGFFALVICLVISKEPKILPLKMGLLTLGSSLQPGKVLFGKRLLLPGVQLNK